MFLSIVIAFFTAIIATPLVMAIGRYLGIYAKINQRTIHKKPIVRIGGVAIFVGFMLAATIFLRIDQSIKAIIFGGAIIFFVGLVDDMVELNAKVKFLFQIIAAVVTIQFGHITLNEISIPFGFKIMNPVIIAVFTYIWVLGITNAINLIDGLDGLSCGVSAIALVFLALNAYFEMRMDIVWLCLLLASPCFGFLIFNFNPAKIFMGDCGALFLGFMLANLSILGFKTPTFTTLGTPIFILVLPIIDTISAIIRRKLTGKKISDADKNHVHHILMNTFGHRNAVLILYGFTIMAGIGSLIYLYKASLGNIYLIIFLIGVEIFIEYFSVISPNYHPILSLCRIVKKTKK